MTVRGEDEENSENGRKLDSRLLNDRCAMRSHSMEEAVTFAYYVTPRELLQFDLYVVRLRRF